MRLGVLDIGSNSARLQVVEVRPGAPPLPEDAVKESTMLGESITEDGSLGDGGIERVSAAVCQMMSAARRLAVEQLFAFTTSAIRDAPNRDEILGRIEQDSGIRPQLLSGEDEAKLTYLAAHQWCGWAGGRLLVLDIGGGSMEIALGRDVEPQVAVSLALGAGRLTRDFVHDDPPTGKQVKKLRHHVRQLLREASERLRWEGAPNRVVGTSKTLKQLARLSGAPSQRQGPFVPRILRADDLKRWLPRLAGLRAEERAGLRGISRSRATQILAGAVVASETMRALDVAAVTLCPWALREGIMLHYLHRSFDNSQDLPLQALGPETPDRALGKHESHA